MPIFPDHEESEPVGQLTDSQMAQFCDQWQVNTLTLESIMENCIEEQDYLVSKHSITSVEEYEKPKGGYEVVIAIPAAFTPVCAGELETLDDLFARDWGMPEGMQAVSVRVVMLDNPHSVQQWLKSMNLGISVLVSDYAASAHDLTTGDKLRPLSRTMVVNFYQERAAKNDLEKSVEQFPFGKYKFYETVELLRYTTHMDITRNFDEAFGVIREHAKNRLA
jgi:peroxiredoxin